MKTKINRCLIDSFDRYGDFSCNNATSSLERLFISFISFLRENYSTLDPEYPYENYELDSDFWQDNKTGEVVHINKILEEYERGDNTIQ